MRYWTIILLLLCSCKVKKDLNKSSLEETKVERVAMTEEIITANRSNSLSKINQVINGNSIIYPRGKFIFENGRFEGEADSVISVVQNTQSTEVMTSDTTHTKSALKVDSTNFHTVKSQVRTKQIERTPHFLGWIGGLALFLFLVFIIWRVKTFKP